MIGWRFDEPENCTTIEALIEIYDFVEKEMHRYAEERIVAFAKKLDGMDYDDINAELAKFRD